MSLLHILVVDDDALFKRLLKMQLKQYTSISANFITLSELETTLLINIDLLILTTNEVKIVSTVRKYNKPLFVMTNEHPGPDIELYCKSKNIPVAEKMSLTIDKFLDLCAQAMESTSVYKASTLQLSVAKEAHMLSLRTVSYLIACASAFAIIVMSLVAFAVDVYAQLIYQHKYVMPGWIGVEIIPGLIAIVSWLYANHQQKLLVNKTSDKDR